MEISKRSKISLAQLLGAINNNDTHLILDKYDLNPYASSSLIELSQEIQFASSNQVSNIILEIISTGKALRSKISPKPVYDQPFEEFRKSILLDGYIIDDNNIKSLDPNFEGREPVEDQLVIEVSQSNLDQFDEILDCISASASDFIKAHPDYNGSLTNIRIALETIVRKIALQKGFAAISTGNTWGPSLAYLRTNGFLSDKEEKSLASIFTFISDGAHIPIGFSEEEFVRLGRNICASMCYFVIKKHNA